MRQVKYDIPKNLTQTRKELGQTCKHKDCNKPLTNMKGPGAGSYCRDHQLSLSSYGGYGRPGRLHTFHRSDICSCCGQDINDDPRWKKASTFFGVELTEKQQHEIKRRYNHGDHNHREADGGNDTADNINALCSFCHWFKTVINNDGRRSSINKDQDVIS